MKATRENLLKNTFKLRNWYKKELPTTDKEMFILYSAVVILVEVSEILEKIAEKSVNRECKMRAALEKKDMVKKYIHKVKGFGTGGTTLQSIAWFETMRKEYLDNKESWYPEIINEYKYLLTLD